MWGNLGINQQKELIRIDGEQFFIINRIELHKTTLLQQRISIAIQRGYAASVLGTQRHMLMYSILTEITNC